MPIHFAIFRFGLTKNLEHAFILIKKIDYKNENLHFFVTFIQIEFYVKYMDRMKIHSLEYFMWA